MIPRKQQPTSDPGPAKSSSGEDICRDYLWGTCNKHTRCIYRHELDIDKMKEILQFCHDYQNRNRCTRANCKFIHATKEEQNAFHATGQVPRVLAERHAALATATPNMSNAETIPQIAMFINESFMTQPPPAPWPPLPPPQGGQPVATSAPPPPPALPPRHAPVLPSRLAPSLQPVPQAQQPPPPPAPTPAPMPAPVPTPAPTPVHQMCPAPTPYHAIPAQNTVAMFPLNQPPLMVPEDFDASVPPPPIPTHINSNNQLKRKLDANGNVSAGSSKIREDGSEVSENFCESCVERKISIDGYKMQMEALHNEEETEILIYKKKLQEYEMGREILKSLVEPDLFQILDKLIEGTQMPRDSLRNLNSTNSSFMSGSTAEPLQAMLKLFQMIIGGGQRNAIEPVPSTSREDEAQSSRWLNVSNYANQSPDFVNLVIEALRNSTASERSPTMEVRNNEGSDMSRLGNNRGNGLNHLANGQKSQHAPLNETSRYGVAPGYSGPTLQSQDFGAHAHQNMPNYSLAGPSGYSGGGPHVPPPPQVYPMGYHLAIPPPPNRNYYGQNPPTSNVPNIHYNGANRAPVPGPSQGMQPPTSPAALRPNQPNAPNYN